MEVDAQQARAHGTAAYFSFLIQRPMPSSDAPAVTVLTRYSAPDNFQMLNQHSLTLNSG